MDGQRALKDSLVPMRDKDKYDRVTWTFQSSCKQMIMRQGRGFGVPVLTI